MQELLVEGGDLTGVMMTRIPSAVASRVARRTEFDCSRARTGPPAFHGFLDLVDQLRELGLRVPSFLDIIVCPAVESLDNDFFLPLQVKTRNGTGSPDDRSAFRNVIPSMEGIS